MEMPNGSSIGTSSLRRQCQLRSNRPDLEIRDLRGNVGTRLKKLDDGNLDAIILAAAGIKRLGLEHHIKEYLAIDILLPAIGQGAIGIEMRENDADIYELIKPLNDISSQQCVEAERACSKRLFGGCQLPIAAHAVINGNKLSMQGLVGRVNGQEIIYDTVRGAINEGQVLGLQLAEKLLGKGADIILKEIIDA